jgi:hypothetical protein
MSSDDGLLVCNACACESVSMRAQGWERCCCYTMPNTAISHTRTRTRDAKKEERKAASTRGVLRSHNARFYWWYA